jgi:hypothetical protein
VTGREHLTADDLAALLPARMERIAGDLSERLPDGLRIEWTQAQAEDFTRYWLSTRASGKHAARGPAAADAAAPAGAPAPVVVPPRRPGGYLAVRPRSLALAAGLWRVTSPWM